MKNKQDRFSQRFFNRSLKRKIDNKENVYDNRPITAAREGEKIVTKSRPSMTVRIPYTTEISYDDCVIKDDTVSYDGVMEYIDYIDEMDQAMYTQQRLNALTTKYRQGITAYRGPGEQSRIFRSSYTAKYSSYGTGTDSSYGFDDFWGMRERVEVKPSAIVDHIET